MIISLNMIFKAHNTAFFVELTGPISIRQSPVVWHKFYSARERLPHEVVFLFSYSSWVSPKTAF